MLRYLLIVIVIKYSLLHPRWRKPKVEVLQNRQFISTPMHALAIAGVCSDGLHKYGGKHEIRR